MPLDLPPMPEVARRVLLLTEAEDSSPADLQGAILGDPALSARVLRVANSALLGQRRRVETISHAVILLGRSAVRSLVVAAAVRALFLRQGQVGLKEHLMWEHSLRCAVAARLLAARLGHPGAEAAFLGGLLHDIGKAVLNQLFPDVYDEVFESVYAGRMHAQDLEVERLGVSHVTAGAMLCRHWGLPAALEDMVAAHHDLSRARVDREAAAVVHFANLLCERRGLDAPREMDLDLLGTESAAVLGLAGPAGEALLIQGILGDVAAAYEQERQVFEG